MTIKHVIFNLENQLKNFKHYRDDVAYTELTKAKLQAQIDMLEYVLALLREVK